MLKPFDKFNWRDRIGTIAIEIFSVVFAVLLALAANDWRDSQVVETLIRRSVTSIAQEIKNNLMLVRQAHDHHKNVLNRIREVLSEDGEISRTNAQAILEELYESGIVKPGAVVETAWSTAKISGAIQGIDYGIALSLSQVYAFQADYQMATNTTHSAMNLAQFLGAKSDDYLLGIYQGVTTHWWLEKRLINAYQEALEKIEQSGYQKEK